MNRLRSILLALPVALSAQVSTFPPASSTPGGDAVGGASNLTTPGGVPFVNTSGVLNIDANKLFWDNTNKRLGIGTNTPAAALDINNGNILSGGIRISTNSYISIRYYNAGITMGSTEPLNFASANAGSTVDTRLLRISAGKLKIDDGSGGAADFALRRIQLGTASGATCDSSGRFTFEATAGGAGVADTVKVCTKDATDTYSMVPLGGGTTIDASQIVSGQIAKARQNNQTVYADQNITYSTNSDQDMRLGNLRVPSGLFSAIPTASLYSGGYYVITDGNGTNCTAGGGSTATACFSNGTSWVLISGTNATANPTVTFTSQTSVTFTHNLSTDTPIIQCYDASGSRLWIEPSQITSTSTSVSTITFTSSQSGKCVANATGGGGGGGGGSGTVTSVAMTVPSWLSVSGSPITSSGTLAVTMPSASAARTAILPSYTGNGGKCAAVNAGATDIEYITCSGGGGGGTPGGSSGQLQYNSAGSFAGATVGNGLTLASGTLSVDAATVPEILTAAATLNFGVIATATCGEQTITLTGAASQDGIFLGPPADLDAGLVATAYISATNTATIRLCKITSGSTASINKNFRVTVVRGR